MVLISTLACLETNRKHDLGEGMEGYQGGREGQIWSKPGVGNTIWSQPTGHPFLSKVVGMCPDLASAKSEIIHCLHK